MYHTLSKRTAEPRFSKDKILMGFTQKRKYLVNIEVFLYVIFNQSDQLLCSFKLKSLRETNP